MGRKGKGIPNGERGPCASEKKGVKERAVAKCPFLQGEVSRMDGSFMGDPWGPIG